MYIYYSADALNKFLLNTLTSLIKAKLPTSY